MVWLFAYDLIFILDCLRPSDGLHSSAQLRLGRREAMTLNPKWVPSRGCCASAFVLSIVPLHPPKSPFVRAPRLFTFTWQQGENMLCASDVNRAGFMGVDLFVVHICRCFSASWFKEKGRFLPGRAQMGAQYATQASFFFCTSGVVNVFVNLFRSMH